MPTTAPVLSAPKKTIALLVGVDDLAALATAQGVDPHSVSLQGASRDVWALARVLNRLGVGGDRLTLLSNSPQPTGWSVDATWKGAPDASALHGALAAFCEALAADGDARGLFVYCGAGGLRSDGLALLASDTTSLDEDTQVLTMSALRDALSTHVCGRGVVAVLDCAFDAASSVFPRARLRSAPLPANTTERRLLRAEDLVLAAAAPYRPAFERALGLAWRGVWSHALETVLGQVADLPEDDQKAVSWAELAQAAQALVLDAGHGQRPVVWGSTALQASPVRVDGALGSGGMAVVQDQIDPGDVFIILEPGGNRPLGRIEVDSSSGLPVEVVTWHNSGPSWPPEFDLRPLAVNAPIPNEALWPAGEVRVERHPHRVFDLSAGIGPAVPSARGGNPVGAWLVRFAPGPTARLPFAYVRVEDHPAGSGVPGASLPGGELRTMDWFRHLRSTVGANAAGMEIVHNDARWEFRQEGEPLGDGVPGYVYASLSE